MWSLRQAVRVIRRAPLVAVAVVLLTSVGMASVLSIFGPLYSLIRTPMPLPEADRLVRVGGRIPLFNVYKNAFEDVERVRPIFSHIAAYAPTVDFSNDWILPNDDRIQNVAGLAVTPEFFEALNVAPRLGPSLIQQVSSAGLVISDRLWRSRFSARNDALGTRVTVGGHAYTVTAVMPPDFAFPEGIDAWMPIAVTPYGPGLEVIARLRSDVSMARASDWLDAFKRPESSIADGWFRASGPTMQRLGDYLRGNARNTLWTLFAASLALVLLSCVGVVNLLLARGAHRSAEVAVQLALGASRRRLIRQHLLETSVLVAAGAAVGLWLSALGRRWLHAQLPKLTVEWPLTPTSMGMLAGLIAIVTLLSGLAPALYATRRSKTSLLANSVPPVSATGRLSQIELLAALQLALAVGLLTCAVFLGQNLYRQVKIPLGFTPVHVLSFRTALARSPQRLAVESQFPKPAAATTKALREWARTKTLAAKPQIAAEYQRNRLFLRQLIEHLAALPGVTNVGVVSPTPFSQDATIVVHAFSNVVSSQAGPNAPDNGEKVQALNAYVNETGFAVLGVRMQAGRPFSATDINDVFQSMLTRIGEAGAPHAPYPAIVNEALARRVWGETNPVGQYFNTYDHQQPFLVVGVVGNFQLAPGVPSNRPTVYVPWDYAGLTADLVVKVRSDVQIPEVLRNIDASITSLAPDASHVQVHGLNDMVNAAQHDLEVFLTLLASFAAVGIVVASLGTFTAASLFIRSRQREFGIQLALGASPARIRWSVLLRIAVTLVGLPAGWFLGWLIATQLSHYLLDVAPADLTSFAVSSVVAGIAVLASLMSPLLKVGRIDPLEVLRQE